MRLARPRETRSSEDGITRIVNRMALIHISKFTYPNEDVPYPPKPQVSVSRQVVRRSTGCLSVSGHPSDIQARVCGDNPDWLGVSAGVREPVNLPLDPAQPLMG